MLSGSRIGRNRGGGRNLAISAAAINFSARPARTPAWRPRAAAMPMNGAPNPLDKPRRTARMSQVREKMHDLSRAG
jgi:hypothetical protein